MANFCGLKHPKEQQKKQEWMPETTICRKIRQTKPASNQPVAKWTNKKEQRTPIIG